MSNNGAAKPELYIIVRNWRKFQHYKDRTPLWIKNYTELLHDHNYLALGFYHRALLHGVWLLYAAGNQNLPASPARISSMLGYPTEHEWRMRREAGESVVSEWRVDGELMVSPERDDGEDDGERPVRLRDLKRLEKAGFIQLVARTPIAKEEISLASAPQAASPRALARREETEEQEQKQKLKSSSYERVLRPDEDDERDEINYAARTLDPEEIERAESMLGRLGVEKPEPWP